MVGLETTLKRPIVNTRDEPHADPKRFRRLHVIVGDANLSEVATFLKVGTTAIVLAMIEDEAAPTRELSLSDPVRALHQVSADLTLTRPLALADGSTMTALEHPVGALRRRAQYAKEHGLEVLGGEDRGREWSRALGGRPRAASSPTRPSWRDSWTGWPSGRCCAAYQERHSCGWDDHRLAALDLQYHDLRPERVAVPPARAWSGWWNDAEVRRAVTEPPTGTRAWFRGQCLARWPDAVVTANWDSLVFDLGADPLRRVPMMDPLKGTAEHTGRAPGRVHRPAELLNRLNS